MSELVDQQFGNYRLIRYVGGGGFAAVYLGEHMHLKTFAAIKVLHARLSEKEVELFRQEARTIAHLAHPHIVRVLEFGVEGKMPFLVMEYAPNGTLQTRHPSGERVPLPIIISYVEQVAEALQYAHDLGLIHRDVKPGNMLLGRQREVVLSDFGIAMPAHSSRSGGISELAGTSLYMAPEQLQRYPRRASDQYALGVVVYEWLCGVCPFQGNTLQLMYQHVHVPPPPLREHLPDISPAVEQVVLKALAKDPEQRFASVQAFATALEQTSRWECLQPTAPHRDILSVPTQSPPSTSASVEQEDSQREIHTVSVDMPSSLSIGRPQGRFDGVQDFADALERASPSLEFPLLIPSPRPTEPSAMVTRLLTTECQLPPIQEALPSPNVQEDKQFLPPLLAPERTENSNKPRRLSKGKVVLLVGLVLLIVLGSVGAFQVITLGSAITRSTATATVHPTATANVSSLPTATPTHTLKATRTPGKLASVSVVGGNGQVRVSWAPPGFDGGSAITGYTVTPYIGSTNGTPVRVGASASNTTITGLTNGTVYTFQVAASNVIGTGLSTTSGLVTAGVCSLSTTQQQSATVPTAPANVSVVGGSGHPVTVRWGSPNCDGWAPITGYTVTPYIGSTAQTPVQAGASASSTTITGLTSGTVYTFQVNATNAVGIGPAIISGSVTA